MPWLGPDHRPPRPRFVRMMDELKELLTTLRHPRRPTTRGPSRSPGSGSVGMEAVARVRPASKVLVIRNGWFSYGGTQTSRRRDPAGRACQGRRRRRQAPFAPSPVDEVVATIREWRPDVLFAPHAETASGCSCPTTTPAVAAAVHEHGALFVARLIARRLPVGRMGAAAWTCSAAPQKGWSGSPSAVSSARRRRTRAPRRDSSTSFACDLKKSSDHASLRERRPRRITPPRRSTPSSACAT